MENASTSADADSRSFSGPPLSVAEVRGNGSDEASFSLETARAALLHLRDSVTSTEFEKLVNGVMDATAESEAVDSERTETSVSDDDNDMDASTSSDGGSTVRELNEQLLAGDGNTGSVSIESVEPGSTHSTDHGEWSKVTRKRKKSQSSETSTSASGTGTDNAKKGRVDSGLLVYLKGVDFDISKEASRNPLEFCRKIASIAGAVGEVKLLKGCVRVTCLADKQKAILLGFTDWFGKPVSFTEPWSKASSAPIGNRRPAFQKGIIFGVSTELTENDIQSETKAATWPKP